MRLLPRTDMHRCESCAFLGRLYGTTMQVRTIYGRTDPTHDGDPLNLVCFEKAHRLGEEINGLRESTPDVDQRVAAVVKAPRQCEFYVRARSGMTPEAHQRIRERKEQRRWTLLASLAGGAVGGIIAIVATVVAHVLER